jgi:hypothetical protein
MKVRVLGGQSRSRKDPWNSTYCRGKKKAGAAFQDCPPVIVADRLHNQSESCWMKHRFPVLHLGLTDLRFTRPIVNRSKFLAILRGRVSTAKFSLALDLELYPSLPSTSARPLKQTSDLLIQQTCYEVNDSVSVWTPLSNCGHSGERLFLTPDPN